MNSRIKNLVVFTSLIFLICGIAAGTRIAIHNECIDGSTEASPPPEAPDERVDLIWQASLDQRTISWTTADLTVEGPENETKGIFSSLAAKDFHALQKNVPEIRKCYYGREFRVLSMVGNLLTFEDKSENVVEINRLTSNGAEIHFKTVDITGKVSDQRGIKLTDYFSEREIFKGLLNGPDIKAAWAEQKSERLPKTLREFIRGGDSKSLMFKEYRYVIYDDFLSQFVFEEVEGDKVKVKLMFPSNWGRTFDHVGISFDLTITPELREPLRLAAEGSAGFLEKDADLYSGGKATKIKFSCGE